ncbi:uncharacterized protein G2W53_009323 [Senna tora]|uniref:Uncharacterized protein n=1 Tax=Senna tora TaxID=362788 RepID=A0A835C7Y9_9FABA|nr:uncharacterized protein G2W53_009323 [Senna tora]
MPFFSLRLHSLLAEVQHEVYLRIGQCYCYPLRRWFYILQSPLETPHLQEAWEALHIDAHGVQISQLRLSPSFFLDLLSMCGSSNSKRSLTVSVMITRAATLKAIATAAASQGSSRLLKPSPRQACK